MEFSMKDSFRVAVELDSNGRNTVMYDDVGNPNIMVRIDKYNMRDIGIAHDGVMPAFDIGNGRIVNEIWVSKYPNMKGVSGLPASMCLPSKTNKARPYCSATKPDAIEMCKAKGKGWHLMTNPEWCAIWLKAQYNGTLPHRSASEMHVSIESSRECMEEPYSMVDGVLWALDWELCDGLELRGDPGLGDWIYWFGEETKPDNNFIDGKYAFTRLRIDSSGPEYDKEEYYKGHFYRKDETANDPRCGGNTYRPLSEFHFIVQQDSNPADKPNLEAEGLIPLPKATEKYSQLGFEWTKNGDRLGTVRGGVWSDRPTTPLSIAMNVNDNTYWRLFRSVYISY